MIFSAISLIFLVVLRCLTVPSLRFLICPRLNIIQAMKRSVGNSDCRDPVFASLRSRRGNPYFLKDGFPRSLRSLGKTQKALSLRDQSADWSWQSVPERADSHHPERIAMTGFPKTRKIPMYQKRYMGNFAAFSLPAQRARQLTLFPGSHRAGSPDRPSNRSRQESAYR